MMSSPRLRSLEDKHAILEREIMAQGTRPRPDEMELARLKREKLKLREEIERLRRSN
ncbi:YdcH family protein [Belnapia sp. T6]|uniref:YdcH family protein n=1 Tax=Belnapia mucosa TaxID=2804532 RepID=A0ABS1V0W1_9PROT|nr:YdcH family protein [Belnapia mucosa]MBL6455339.1 YdcH family protein [Belnapia mucosa]